MRIIYTKSNHEYKFTHIDCCCMKMRELLEFDLSHGVFGGLYLTGFKKTFMLYYCPFCGEKIKVVYKDG